jgi:hypothetical protein
MTLDIHVRQATPADIPAITRMKADFAREEGYPEIIRATEEDWLRDLFGPATHFTALLAEAAMTSSAC